MVSEMFILLIVLRYILGMNSLGLEPSAQPLTFHGNPCTFLIVLLLFLVFISLSSSKDSPCCIYLRRER